MRENAMKYKDTEATSSRRFYLHIRKQILEQKYGPLEHS